MLQNLIWFLIGSATVMLIIAWVKKLVWLSVLATALSSFVSALSLTMLYM